MAKKRKGTSSQRVLPELNANAFIIGNGTSRKDFELEWLMGHGNLYGLNWFFKKEFMPTVIVASDEPMTKSIIKAHAAAVKQRQFFTWFPKPGSGAKKASCPEKFAAGPMATWVACDKHEAKNVFLIGMDFFGFGSKSADKNGKLNNLYAGEKHYMMQTEGGIAPTYRNWQRRFQYTMKSFPNVQFWHVNPFEGDSPERLKGLPNFHQISWDNLQKHLKEGAELVDDLKKTEEDIRLATEQNPHDLMATLERHIVSQENVIYRDILTDKQVQDIRVQAGRIQQKQGLESGGAVMRIAGMDISVPMMGLAKNSDGTITYPNEEQIRAVVKREQMQRMNIMVNYWQKNNFIPQPLDVPKDTKPAKATAVASMPPPPPPLNTNIKVPPPPPPVF